MRVPCRNVRRAEEESYTCRVVSLVIRKYDVFIRSSRFHTHDAVTYGRPNRQQFQSHTRYMSKHVIVESNKRGRDALAASCKLEDTTIKSRSFQRCESESEDERRAKKKKKRLT